MLFKEYHPKYPSHGYRWLNAKIFLDTGKKMSDPYAHKCCKAIGIKSNAKHYRHKKPGNPYRVFPNLLMTEMAITGPVAVHCQRYDSVLCKRFLLRLTLYTVRSACPENSSCPPPLWALGPPSPPSLFRKLVVISSAFLLAPMVRPESPKGTRVLLLVVCSSMWRSFL